MNRQHQRNCSSPEWAEYIASTVLPAALNGLTLGPRLLELGPGYGASTGPLTKLAASLTAVESDPVLAEKLSARLGDKAEVVHGDATRLSFPDGTFNGVVCFTMLHHVPSAKAQDKLFAEAARVLAPGGVFAGTDSVASLRWRLHHLGDTCTPINPRTLPGRLARAGFTRIGVDVLEHGHRRVTRFAAYTPGPVPDLAPQAGPAPAPREA
jgi:SAM-dependent methyltransferase